MKHEKNLLGFFHSKLNLLWKLAKSRLTRFFQNKILESCWYFYIVIALNDGVKPSMYNNGSNSILTKSGLTRFFQIYKPRILCLCIAFK
jgi:hypothetical protein